MVRSRILSTFAILTVAGGLMLSGCSRTSTPNAQVKVPGTPKQSNEALVEETPAPAPSLFDEPTQTAKATDLSNTVNRRGPGWTPGDAPPAQDAEKALDSKRVPPPEADSPFQMDDSTGGVVQNANLNNVEDAVEIADLDMVHFNYDAYKLGEEWKNILAEHAEWLKQNEDVHVQIEGHCDERGTEEYNVTLGQRRADAVREFLVEKGVSEHRLSTISYGKLRPLTFEQNEEAHALNRRAMFLVYQPEQQTASAY